MRFWIVLLTVLCFTAAADGMVAEKTVDAVSFCEDAVPEAHDAPAATALVRAVRAAGTSADLPAAPAGARIFRPPRA